MEEKRNAYRLCVGKAEGTIPPARPRQRWTDNIKMDLGEIGWGGVDWIGLAQDRDKWRALVNLMMTLQVPYNAGKPLSGFSTGGLSSSAQFHRVSDVNVFPFVLCCHLPSDLCCHIF
jgi:hypothetical protein